MLTIQWTAFNNEALESADADTSFLQGHRPEIQGTEAEYSRTLDEIACAVNNPLAEAVYGLGSAPRSWWLSVDQFLTSVVGRRPRTDPII